MSDQPEDVAPGKEVRTEVLDTEQLDEISGGAIDSYMNFGTPSPPPPPKH